MYFAVQAMAAELSTGTLVFLHLDQSKMSVIVTGLKAEYLKKAKSKKDQIKNIAYYSIPVKFQINGNFLGYIKFKRALSLSNKMLNFESEKIQVESGDSTGAIKVSGTLTIVGLADEFF